MGRPGFKSPKMQYDDFRKKTYPPPPPGTPFFRGFLAFFAKSCENDGRALFSFRLCAFLNFDPFFRFPPLFPGLKKGGA